MSVPDYVAEADRNFVTCGSAAPRRFAGDTQACHRALGFLEERVKRLPFEVDPFQLMAATALLERKPLAVKEALRLVCCPPTGARLQGRHHGVPRLPCRSRACAYCADRKAFTLSCGLARRAAKYAAPLAALVTAPSKTMLDLPAAMHRLRGSLAKLRRRRWFFAAIPSGVFVLEAPLTRDGRRWNVHAHGILDARGDSLEFRTRCDEEWSALVGVPGAAFAFEPLRDRNAFFRYGLKVGREKSTVPDPGTLSPALMAHLEVALRGKRLHITWGAEAAERRKIGRSPESRVRAGARGRRV